TTDNKRLTKDKTITGAINELFTSANNGKKLISDVVGNPLLATDTFQQQRDKIQTLKNTFASNLSSKKVSASSTEGLSNLINKILNINTGLKYAMGTLNRQNGERTATVSGLSFRPDFVYVNGLNGYIGSSDINPMIFIYSGSKVNFEENINRWGTYGHWNGMNGNPHDFPILHRLHYSIGSIEVTNNSFTISDCLYSEPSRLKWIAIAIEE
ncbi:phage tail protein, partial [Clostridium botulinum]|nr:phage tail protein [Clostridium botulinum]